MPRFLPCQKRGEAGQIGGERCPGRRHQEYLLPQRLIAPRRLFPVDTAQARTEAPFVFRAVGCQQVEIAACEGVLEIRAIECGCRAWRTRTAGMRDQHNAYCEKQKTKREAFDCAALRLA